MSFPQEGLNSHHICRLLYTYKSKLSATGQKGNQHENKLIDNDVVAINKLVKL